MTHRIVQIGCGRWGRNILRDLAALGARVTVVDPDAAAREHARDLAAETLASATDVTGPVDGYVVATPTDRHADVVDALLATGRPIYCEKPLTHDVERARRIAKHCTRRNLFVMEKWRYHPGVRALRELATSEELGPVRGLHSVRVQWSHPHTDVDAVWILAPHDLSIAETILGQVPEARFAVAEGARGSGAGMVAGFGDDPWFVMEVSTLREQTRREVRLVCERGIGVLDDPLADHVKLLRTDDRAGPCAPERRAISTELPLLLELRAFLAYLDGGPEPLCDVDAAVASVERIARLRAMAGLPAT
ncbi:MAG: Gfo/Idh/MocA family protein [Myxococcota bacterium]